MSLYDYLKAVLSEENRLYDEGKEQCGDEGIDCMTGPMRTHQKVIDIFEQLKAGNTDQSGIVK